MLLEEYGTLVIYYESLHSLANWDSCPTPAKNEGIEYLQTWPHRN